MVCPGLKGHPGFQNHVPVPSLAGFQNHVPVLFLAGFQNHVPMPVPFFAGFQNHVPVPFLPENGHAHVPLAHGPCPFS
jgi:hypothetical protein